MLIEIWSDYVCPFCYIGKRRLEAALEKFQHKDMVQIAYKSFELDQQAPKTAELSVYEVLSQKYRVTVEEAKQMCDSMAEQAMTVGLKFNFDKMKRTNTFDAHRLAKFAETKEKGKELVERLLQAYFTESKAIGEKSVLIDVGTDVGLEPNEIKSLIEGTDFSEAVRRDEQEAQQIGIQGVPFFVIDGKYAISGAQPTEVFLQTLQQIWDNEYSNRQIDQGLTCTDDMCDFPNEEKGE